MIDLLSYTCIGLGIGFWFWGTWPLIGDRSVLFKLHSLSVADTLGSMSIIVGLLLKIPNEWPLLILGIISLAIWNTVLGYVLAYCSGRSSVSSPWQSGIPCWGMCWHTVLAGRLTMNDSYIYVITALLPLSALMLVLQANPYHALVVQGIMGAVAALVFALLGAADVALTQALMGTLLAITLYAIAVRSSLVMRLGVIEDSAIAADEDSLPDSKTERHFGQLMDELRTIFSKHYMRLELVSYTNTQALQRALMDKEVHATCTRRSPDDDQEHAPLYDTTTRVRRLYEIMQAELSSPATILTYVNALDSGEKHL